jgi:hypothetical protein
MAGQQGQYLHASDVATRTRDAWVVIVRGTRNARGAAAGARVEPAVAALTPSRAARLVEDGLECSTLSTIEASAVTSTLFGQSRIRRRCCAEKQQDGDGGLAHHHWSGCLRGKQGQTSKR